MRNHRYKAVDVKNNDLIVAQGSYYDCRYFFSILIQEQRLKGYVWELFIDMAILKEIKTGKTIQALKIIEEGNKYH